MSTFAIAARDELWLNGRRIEARLSHGVAVTHGDIIEASDARDDALVSACDEALPAARAIAERLRDARVRIVIRAERGVSVETTMSISIAGVSVVTTPADAVGDYELLQGALGRKPVRAPAALPIVWRNGSAAVLLHEAIGHAREHDAAPVAWPEWLGVDIPLGMRRATFRDVPLPRMTRVAARQSGAPFTLPDRRIEVLLVGGGSFDPVTDEVTIDVAVSSAGAFTLRAPRAAVARALAGAIGEPLRYPGVICSREGQELYVATSAPVMVTDALP